MLGCRPTRWNSAGRTGAPLDGAGEVSLADIATKSMVRQHDRGRGDRNALLSGLSPPFMVGMAEIELDTETGQVDVIDYAAVVDCGTPVNPNLARVQTEGGIVQGIGMALYEDVTYEPTGRIMEQLLHAV